MKLSDIPIHLLEDGKVIRDGEIESLGILVNERIQMLSFVESEEFVPLCLENPQITGIVTTSELVGYFPHPMGLIVCENPRLTFYRIHNHLASTTSFYWTPFTSVISQEATIHPSAIIAPNNVKIGKGTVIEAGAIIQEHSIIGEDCTLRAGCIIGSHGFEFKRAPDSIMRVEHAGGVLLHDRVEIQNGTNVNRAIFGDFTEIGEDSKIDSLVHVGHAAKIGKRTMIAACSMITACLIGDDVWIGPGTSLRPQLTIGDKAFISMGSVVTKNVNPGEQVTGNFAIPHERFIEFMKTIR